MKLCLFFGIISFTSIAFCANSPKPQPAQCPKSSLETKPMTPSLSGSTGFYGVGKGISDGLQKAPDSQTYQDLNNLISGKESYADTIKSMVLSQVGAIIFWSVGFIFILATIALCIVTCIWHFRCACAPKKSAVRSEITGMVYIGLLATTLAFSIAGVIIFNLAETDLTDSIDNGVTYADKIVTDIFDVLSNGKNQLTCEVKSSTSQALAEIRSFIKNYAEDVIDGTTTRVGLTAVNNFDSDAFKRSTEVTYNKGVKLIGDLQTLQMSPKTGPDCRNTAANLLEKVIIIQSALSALSLAAHSFKNSRELKEINDLIKKIKDEVESQSKGAAGAIDSAEVSLDDTINSIVHFLDKLQQEVKAVKKISIPSIHQKVVSYVSTGMVIGIRVGVTILACLGLICCILAIVVVVLSLMKQDGLAMKLSVAVIISFFVSIVLCIILFKIAMTVFAMGLVVSSVCVPVFGDDKYTLLYWNSDSSNWKSFLNQHWIAKKLLNDNAEQAKSANLAICDNNNLDQTFIAYSESLSMSHLLSQQFVKKLETLAENAPKTPSIAKDLNKTYFTKTEAILKQAVTKLFKALQDDIFKCRPLVDVYNNAGISVCEQFGLPVHGMWASVGLGGVVLFFQIILLLLTFRWLRTHSKNTVGKNGKSDKTGTSGSMEKAGSKEKDKKKKKKKDKANPTDKGSVEKTKSKESDGDPNKDVTPDKIPGNNKKGSTLDIEPIW